MNDGDLPADKCVASRRVRPTEVAFLVLGAGAAGVLLGREGWWARMTLETVAGTSIYFFLLVSAVRWPAMADARVRLGINYLFVAWFYGATSRITAALHTASWDAELLAADRRLFGETPSVGLEAWTHPWMTDVMSGCYSCYHVYMHGMIVVMAFAHSPRAARHFGDCLYAAFAVGFAGYLLVPALGPGGAFPGLYVMPLAGGTLTWLNAWLVGNGAAVYGTFPSLHLLVTVVLLDHDWRRCRRRFWWVLGPSLGLLASTLYLRYHYAVDLLAGVICFAALRGTTLRWSPPPTSEGIPTQIPAARQRRNTPARNFARDVS